MLQLRLLGALQLQRGARRLVLPPSKRTRALLAYLAVTGRRHSRERLCDLLWGSADDPRGALRWSLSKLRPLVDEPDFLRIRADREAVVFERQGSHIDVVALAELREAGFGAVPVGELEELAARIEGEFLEGLDLPEQPAFAAWSVTQRALAVQLHVALRRALIDRYGEKAEEALAHARVLCALDPLSETSHALLCRLLRATGRREEADQQFAASVRALRGEGIVLSGELERTRIVLPAVAVQPDIDVATDRKPATVLFAAFPGFLGESAMEAGDDTELVLARLDALAQLVLHHVAVLGGEVISKKSDGLLTVFGAPRAQEDHAVRATQAAVDIIHAARSSQETGLRVGLASGEVIVRPEAGSPRWATLGRAVELAPRIAEAAEPGGIAVSESVFEQIEGLFATEAIPFAGQTVYRVRGGSAQSTRWRARAFRSLARFQGRARESAIFARALEDARAGRGSIVTVVGEAGIGKSRMVAENLDRARERGGWKTLETGTSPREAQIVFAPLRALLHTWLGTGLDTAPAALAERLRARLVRLGPEYVQYASALLNALGLPAEEPAWLGLGVEQRRESTIEALVSILLRESEESPAIVLFEDLHWVDEGSQEFLKLLVSAIACSRLLLVVTCRPEYNVPWANRPNSVQCRLDTLSEDEAGSLLDDVLGAGPALDDIKSKIARHCEGNPLFLEECVRALIETGSLVGRAGAYALARPFRDLATPATVQGILAARIDRLTPARRFVLQAAAVIGRTFSSELLATVIERPAAQVREALGELEVAEFVSLARLKPDREYRFVHALTQQVTYAGMLQSRRIALHRAVGLGLQRAAGERVSEIVETIADHFDTGELWEEASDYRLRAAKRNKEHYAYELALEHATRAAECARAAKNAARQIEALTLAGDLHSLLGNLQIANGSYATAANLCSQPSQRRRIAARQHVVRSIVRDGGHIAFYEHGSGPQTLVFVHPFVYGGATFQPLVEQLSSDFAIVTIDPRGTGASDALPARYGINDHMLDVVAVLEAATHGKPVVAVGISRGALLLIRVAVLHPALLTKMILVGPPLKQTVGIGVPLEETASFKPEQLGIFAEALRAGNIALALEMFAPTIFSERGTEELRRRFVEQCLKLPTATVANFFTFDRDADVTEILEHVSTPTLIVHGSEDRDTPLSTAVALSERIPGARLHVFEGKGHLPMFTATADFCAVLRAFVGPQAHAGHVPTLSRP